MKTVAPLALCLAACGASGAAAPAPSAAAAPSRRAICHDRSVRLLAQDASGNAQALTFSCEGDRAVAVVVEARVRAGVRHARWELVDDEWRRLWDAAEATGWRRPDATCVEARRVAGASTRTWTVTVVDGAAGRTLVCDVWLAPPAPFVALEAFASGILSGIPDTQWVSVAATPASAVGTVGVIECDEFMTRYLACIHGHFPEAARQSTLDSLKQTADAWRQAAGTPEGRAALANTCRQMSDATKQAVSSLGCSW